MVPSICGVNFTNYFHLILVINSQSCLAQLAVENRGQNIAGEEQDGFFFAGKQNGFDSTTVSDFQSDGTGVNSNLFSQFSRKRFYLLFGCCVGLPACVTVCVPWMWTVCYWLWLFELMRSVVGGKGRTLLAEEIPPSEQMETIFISL